MAEPSVPSGSTPGVPGGGGVAPVQTGENAQQGPANPPYTYKFLSRSKYGVALLPIPVGGGNSTGGYYNATDAEFESLNSSGQIYPPQNPPAEETNPPQTTQNQTPAPSGNTSDDYDPLDPRMLFLSQTADGSPTAVFSFTSNPNITAPLVQGWIVKDPNGSQEDGKATPLAVQDTEVSRDVVYDNAKFKEAQGVPAIMSNMSYISFAGSGGEIGLKNLIDRENQPRWYDVTDKNTNNSSSAEELTVTGLIDWSKAKPKTPYRYQDFVFLKWWKKIPLNYMITLRRFTRPINDSMGTAFDHEFAGKNESKLRSAAHAITFLGEDAGNKISSIMGGISAGLNWKDIKADVWEVTNDAGPATADSPFPNLARTLGFLTAGANGAKPSEGSSDPPDPYKNGPYANKIIGPVTVIDTVKARERGITFKHEINLVFEYSARSIGGVNSKAAMLDILSNIMILTFNTASFWGGENRFMPQGGAGGLAPFLGGAAGRKAWLEGNPAAFFSAVTTQFNGALKNLGDLFNKILDDPISGLKQLASGAMSNYMKLNTTGGRGHLIGLHSLLTGEPVGEWHVTVGNPMNPMMMIGNLICTNVKIEFNDELGPDDFPTELKATITLEHGRPRDKSAIESMFNKGGGRLYSLPPKMKEEDLFASYNQTAVDAPTGSTPNGKTKGSNGKNKKSNNSNPLVGDPKEIDKIAATSKTAARNVAAPSVAIYNHGYAVYSSKKK